MSVQQTATSLKPISEYEILELQKTICASTAGELFDEIRSRGFQADLSKVNNVFKKAMLGRAFATVPYPVEIRLIGGRFRIITEPHSCDFLVGHLPIERSLIGALCCACLLVSNCRIRQSDTSWSIVP